MEREIERFFVLDVDEIKFPCFRSRYAIGYKHCFLHT